MYALRLKRMFGGRTSCANRSSMNLQYNGYYLKTLCSQLPNGRYSICVEISRESTRNLLREVFIENDRLACILLQESEKEAIRLGKNVIDRKIIRF